jgi:prevent-host-death family protein
MHKLKQAKVKETSGAAHHRGTKEQTEESALEKKKLYFRNQMESILRRYRQQSMNAPRSEPEQRPWQLQTAKARFSEVFRLARMVGPQLITRQGKEAVVVMSVEQFEQLVGRTREPASLVQFFAESPLAGLELNLDRSKDTGRKIDL